MRRLLTALAVLAIATPAWAANNDRPVYTNTGPEGAWDVCIASGTPSSICTMKNVAEHDAITIALKTLKTCSTQAVAQPDECPVIRAYVQQRWGY